MDGSGGNRGVRSKSLLQFLGEEDVGKLRLPIGLPRVVGLPGLEVVEVDAIEGDEMRVGGEVDDASIPGRLGSFHDLREEQVGQMEMSEMVDADLPLKAVCGLLTRRYCHHPCVVHQQVDLLSLALNLRCKPLDALQGRQIELERGEFVTPCQGSDLLLCLLSSLLASARQHNFCSKFRQSDTRLLAQTCVGTCDDGDLPRQVRCSCVLATI
mmetsp:Transcript_6155/g.14210  ORF Transcript_6155/g.14210 Transcript_6155/m.14210 type:complete len:212 (-) Transcript_6155:251-886(-)